MGEVTFNIANSNGRKFTLLTENENLAKSIVSVKENNTITYQDMQLLQQIASKNGDAGILENVDLNGQHKLNLAKMNNFDEYYDIKLSKDGKMFQITVKKTNMVTQNPTIGTIKSDFGVKNNVLVQGREIPYGNEALIEKRSEPGSSADGRNTDYDQAKLLPGDTINIPVACINITGTPRGFWGRAFQ